MARSQVEQVYKDVPCKWKDQQCCMRIDGYCQALIDTDFWDDECHFRKKEENGPNLYDMWNRYRNTQRRQKGC